jgi:hypothetical protein
LEILAIDEGATIFGRLGKIAVSLNNLKALSNWGDTYEGCCLKADLAAARGSDKLRSMIEDGVVFEQSLTRNALRILMSSFGIIRSPLETPALAST